jgi:hypothetical protein
MVTFAMVFRGCSAETIGSREHKLPILSEELSIRSFVSAHGAPGGGVFI